MATRWSEERAWAWYDKKGWLRGCNYMPANCANRIDMWQSLDFDEHIKCAEEEFKLMQELGFNSVRLILDFTVWCEEHDEFIKNVESYVSLCDKYGISVMFVLGNDCCVPKNDLYVAPHIGEQKYDWGYHGGRKNSPHQTLYEMGFSPLDETDTREQFYKFVAEMIDIYKDDERICVWDLYNEPGNSRRDSVTLPHLKEIFKIARDINPIQPLTACYWRAYSDEVSECEQYCLDNSDIISYHNYRGLETNVKILRKLKKYNRPIFNTEWLGRIIGSTVQELFPLFYIEKVSCYNWGFVAGKYQTYEPYNAQWEGYERGEANDIDFRLWFHDLYRPSHRPYDPKETELIRRICDLADADMENV